MTKWVLFSYLIFHLRVDVTSRNMGYNEKENITVVIVNYRAQ